MIKDKRDFLTGWKGFFKMVSLDTTVNISTKCCYLWRLFFFSNAVQMFQWQLIKTLFLCYRMLADRIMTVTVGHLSCRFVHTPFSYSWPWSGVLWVVVDKI